MGGGWDEKERVGGRLAATFDNAFKRRISWEVQGKLGC